VKARGKLDEAEPLYRRALASAELEPGSKHPYTLNIMNNLAMLLMGRGELAEASEMMTRVYQGELDVLSAEHADTRWTACHILELDARRSEINGCNDEALTLFQDCVKERILIRGEEDPSTVRCREAVIRIEGAGSHLGATSQEGRGVVADEVADSKTKKKKRARGGGKKAKPVVGAGKSSEGGVLSFLLALVGSDSSDDCDKGRLFEVFPLVLLIIALLILYGYLVKNYL